MLHHQYMHGHSAGGRVCSPSTAGLSNTVLYTLNVHAHHARNYEVEIYLLVALNLTLAANIEHSWAQQCKEGSCLKNTRFLLA